MSQSDTLLRSSALLCVDGLLRHDVDSVVRASHSCSGNRVGASLDRGSDAETVVTTILDEDRPGLREARKPT